MTKRTQAEAEAAVRVLIEWAGDDPDREGLLETPARVAKAYRELFAGYDEDPRAYLEKTFEEVGGYDELIVLRDIRVVSFCEHHMLPFLGRAHVGYLPTNRVVGISKLSRVVNAFSRRLQIQEKLTAEIAEAINDILQPQGVGVMIEAEHSCMTMRGVNTPGSNLITSRLMGVMRDDPRTREEFLRARARAITRPASSTRSQNAFGKSRPQKRFSSCAKVGDVTLISISLPAITSRPANTMPSRFSNGATALTMARSASSSSPATALPPTCRLARKSPPSAYAATPRTARRRSRTRACRRR